MAGLWKNDELTPLKSANGSPDVENPPSSSKTASPAAAGSPAAESTLCGLPSSTLPGAAYCVASASMILLNKLALSSFDFHSVTMLLLFQCTFCVTAVKVTELLGLIELEPFNLEIAKVWFPANCIFVGMLWTSFLPLQLLTVGMVSVLKNITNLFTIAGDIAIYGKSYGTAVWVTLALIAVSAICGAVTDLSFNMAGYLWQIVNCAFTAGYSLSLRGAMDKVAPLTRSGKKLDEFSMVFYNNLLSLPLLCLVAAVNGEFVRITNEPAIFNRGFQLAASMSALCGFLISFCSLWFLSTTTATTFSLVGSLNKIPIAMLGLFFFDAKWSPQNVASILVGLLAGVIFVRAKQLEAPAAASAPKADKPEEARLKSVSPK